MKYCSSLISHFPGIQSEVLFSCSLIHHLIFRPPAPSPLFHFSLPIDPYGQVAFWPVLGHPPSILGRKSWQVFMTSQQQLCLFPVEMVIPVLLQVVIFLVFHSAGRYYVVLPDHCDLSASNCCCFLWKQELSIDGKLCAPSRNLFVFLKEKKTQNTNFYIESILYNVQFEKKTYQFVSVLQL